MCRRLQGRARPRRPSSARFKTIRLFGPSFSIPPQALKRRARVEDLHAPLQRFAYTVGAGPGAGLREIRAAIHQVGARPGRRASSVETSGIAMRPDRLAVMAPTTRSAGLIRNVTSRLKCVSLAEDTRKLNPDWQASSGWTSHRGRCRWRGEERLYPQGQTGRGP